jgi:hypothetical protein
MEIYINRSGQRYGPFSLSEIQADLEAGKIQPTDLAWHNGADKWFEVWEIEGVTVPKRRVPEPSPIPQVNHAWYYSYDGKRIGPTTESQIRTLIATNIIRRDSLMWCEGMADWTPAYQTDIRHFFGHANTPPPLVGESVNNGIVWTLAFVPIFAVLVEAILAAVTDSPQSDFWWVALPLNIGLSLADAQKLKNAGHDTKGMTAWAILVPVYLFVRASRLKQNNGYAFVWLVTFFISLFM